MILCIDNYDSFTYNLVHLIRRVERGVAVEVHRNDCLTPADIAARRPRAIAVSPGPGRPDDAGVSLSAIQQFAGTLPILGVCLGHQCIGQALGGRVVQADALMHGKTSLVEHNGQGLFAGIPSPVTAMRYHSLVLERGSLPDCLQITAWTPDGEVMAVQHTAWPLFGMQFHPESFLTPRGGAMLANFLRIVEEVVSCQSSTPEPLNSQTPQLL